MLLHMRPLALGPRLALRAALGAALGACAAPAADVAPPLPYEPPRVDVLDYDVAVDIDHLARRIAGLDDQPESLRFLLAAARGEPVPGVRAAALAALAQRPDPEGTIGRLLVEALSDDSHVVRSAAAALLGARGDEASRRQLRARLEVESDASVRTALSEALPPGD